MEINTLLTKRNFENINRDIDKIKYIVIHYVGAEGTAKQNCLYFHSLYRGASAHYFVSQNGEIWQCVKDEDKAWHCGGGLQGKGGHTYHGICTNSNSIGIEMCCYKDVNGVWYFTDETVSSTIALVKELMKKYNIPVDRVIRHYDVTGKNCPEPYVRDEAAWRGFKALLTNGSVTDNNNKPRLTVDGSWGKDTTRATQEYLGTKIDGIVSSQPLSNKKYLPNAHSSSWKFVEDYSGSAMARALQRLIGAEDDGYFGKQSVKALQRFLGINDDGYMGPVTVKAWQKYINKKLK